MKRRCTRKSLKSKTRTKQATLVADRVGCANEFESDWLLMIPELLLRIFGHLDYYSLRKSAAVCRFWMQCANDESLAVMWLTKTRCDYDPEGEASNMQKKSIKRLNNGELTTYVGSYDFGASYLEHDYIEIRSTPFKEYEHWDVYLRYRRVEEMMKEGDLIERSCLDLVVGLINEHFKCFESVFLASCTNQIVSENLKKSLGRLGLTDHQLQAIEWMQVAERGPSVKTYPVVPVPNSPLLFDVSMQQLILPDEVRDTEMTFTSSNGIIFTKPLKCAALEVIGLILASTKPERTLIFVETAARAKNWQQYITAAAPSLNVVPEDPTKIFYACRIQRWQVCLMVTSADPNAEISPPYSRLVYDNTDPLIDLAAPIFTWRIQKVRRIARLNSSDPFMLRLMQGLFKQDKRLAERLQYGYNGGRYLRHVKLVPELIRNFVWINQGVKLKIESHSE